MEAHDSAYEALKREFKGAGVEEVSEPGRRGALTGPITGKGGKVYPKAAGYLQLRDVDDPERTISRPLGVAYEGVEDGTEHRMTFLRPDGTTMEREVFPTTIRANPADVTLVYSTLGWTGDEWILINLYPARRPRASTSIGLAKRPVDGRGTL